MASVRQVYLKVENLEDKLRSDLRKAYFPEQIFQAYADFSRDYLGALGKEVSYNLVETAVRDSKVMQSVRNEMDQTMHSYNDLVREISIIRRDAIAKSIVSAEGPDDVHSLTSVFIKYGIKPNLDMFSKAVHLISQTRKDVIENKYGTRVLAGVERIIPNNMTTLEFIFLLNGYSTSTYKCGVQNGRKKEGTI